MPTKVINRKVIIVKRYKRFVPGQAGNEDSTAVSTILLRHSRDGVSNPNWRRDIKNGIDASTPMSAISTNFEYREPVYKANWLWAPYGPSDVQTGLLFVSGFLQGSNYTPFLGQPGLVTSNPSLVEEARAKAIKSLYIKIRGAHSQFAGGVFLAELRKTVRMIARPARAFQDSVVAYKRQTTKLVANRNRVVKGKPSQLSRAELQKTVAGSYLEATFGWQPLLNDVKDGAIALARILSEKPQQRFRAYGQAEKIISQSAQYREDFDVPYYHQSLVEKHVAICTFYGSFQGNAPNELLGPSVERVVKLSGFHLRDFIPTIWEVIPYSFLIDYFINVGDVLSAAMTDTSIVKRITRVDIEENRVRLDVRVDHPKMLKKLQTHYSPAFSIVQSGGVGWYDLVNRTVTRTPTSVPFLLPRYSPPELFSRQSLNIAALLAGARPSKL